MAITKLTDPSETIEGLEASYYIAAHNPMRWTLQRKDFAISGWANNGGNLQITISASAGMTAGDEVYLYSATIYTPGVYAISTVDDPTHITLVLTWSAAGSDGYVNVDSVIPNYYLEVEITDASAVVLGIANFTPSSTGLVTVNISDWIRAQFSLDNDFAYDIINEEDLNIIQNFRLRWKEHWTGSSEAYSGYDDYYWGVDAARQLQAPYGGNMGWYVLMDGLVALFLSFFVKPTWFQGLPFDLSFIFSENISALTPSREIREYNLNDVQQSLAIVALEIGSVEPDNINRLMLATPGAGDVKLGVAITILSDNLITALNDNTLGCGNGWSNFDVTANVFNSVWDDVAGSSATTNSLGSLVVGDIVRITMTVTTTLSGSPTLKLLNAACDVCSNIETLGVGTATYVLTVTKAGTLYAEVRSIASTVLTAVAMTGTLDTLLTERKMVLIEAECMETMIYLAWRNSLGGMEYWRFGHHQEYNLETNSFQVARKDISDLANAETYQDVISKQVKETMLLGAENLKVSEVAAFKQLLISTRVQMLMNPDTWVGDGAPVWQTVIVVENSWMLYKNSDTEFGLQFEIELPKLNLITQ